MNTAAIVPDATWVIDATAGANAPSCLHHRPRLVLLAREETGSGYRVGAGSEPPPAPAAGEPDQGPADEPVGEPAHGSADEAVDGPETVAAWDRVHARLVELGADRAAHERELCRWLLAAERLGVAGRAGYASLREYADRLVGLTGRQTEERLRVGRALAELPLPK